MVISSKIDPMYCKVYVNGLLHLYLVRDRLLGFQGWYESSTCMRIEITLVGGVMVVEYDEREKWESVLKVFDTM